MRTALVNHSGVIQKKILIDSIEGLEQYAKRYERRVIATFERILHSSRDISDLSQCTNNEEKHLSLMHGNGKSLVENVAGMVPTKLNGMLKVLQQYGMIAVNEAGGYCNFDEKRMTIIKDNIPTDREFFPESDIHTSKYLVIENQSDISDNIKSFMEKTYSRYSFITNLRYAEEGEFEKLLMDAISKSCDTIVFETTMINTKQVEQMAKLFELLPPFTFMVFDLSADGFDQTLADVIGEDQAKKLTDRHTIILNPHLIQ